ncbi:MAG: tRNA glutamyl-Q(34) synthetase GluQRS [Verrucomicrobiales bacterium]
MRIAAAITRFAPSPTGFLHLGHAYAALFAAEEARRSGGRFLVRIEDIDLGRSRPEFEDAIWDDLGWLGLAWERPVRRQSEHLASYDAVLERLRALGVLYPCFCTRAEIRAEIDRMASAPQGPDGPLYPGICRHLDPAETADRLAAGDAHAWRIDVAKAAAQAGPLHWLDREKGTQIARPELLGDADLARKDAPASYHIAVVADDAAQGITLVTRGEDLFGSTHLHRLLQALLGFPVPAWHHHRLICDRSGKRLAKRDQATSLRALRADGWTPEKVWAHLGVARTVF